MKNKSTYDYLLKKACLSKKPLSLDKANKIVDRTLLIDRRLMYFYYCLFCGKHHMTSKPPSKEVQNRIKNLLNKRVQETESKKVLEKN